jgi:Tol biopolymer transport system component
MRHRIFTVAALVLLFAGETLAAQTPLTLNGGAASVDGRLRLTRAAGGQVGSAWTSTKQRVVDGFAATFQFQITELDTVGSPGGDGFAFVVQNSGVHALGGGGGDLGYGGMPNSLAVEFDTWPNNEWKDPNDNHISIHTRGTAENDANESASIAGTTAIPNLSDGQVHTAVVLYTPAAGGYLQVVLDNREVLRARVNLATRLALDNGRAYLGWTAATGAAWENHDITFYQFDLPVATTGVAKTVRLADPLTRYWAAPAPVSNPVISGDGRFVAFQVGNRDLYLRDRETGTIEPISISSSGAAANGESSSPAISGDGRFVAFRSSADNLVPGDTNGTADILLRDRERGTTELVSVAPDGSPANEPSFSPAVSADGRFVAFASGAGNLAPGETNGRLQIYLRDRQTGTTERVSVAGSAPADGNSFSPSISADGRFVAFDSYATNLAPPDTNYAPDAFVRDRQSGTTELVSVATDGAPAGYSIRPSISADGRFVAFQSEATNLLPALAGWQAIFLRDRQTETTELMSAAADGSPANDYCYAPMVSADGRFVAFQSSANNLVPGDTNGAPDVFVRDRQSGQSAIVSIGARGDPSDGRSDAPAISADGRFVTFYSEATNLVPGVGGGGIYVRDRVTPSTEAVAVPTSASQPPAESSQPAISADGQWVAFVSAGQVYTGSRISGAVELVSVAPDGAPANGPSASPAISADGRFVAFTSAARNLAPGNAAGAGDVYVRDRQTGTTELVSVGIDGAGARSACFSPSISADGRFVAFVSDAENLLPGGTRGTMILVRDRLTGTTEQVGDASSYAAEISADGRFVAFWSYEGHQFPGDPKVTGAVFARDRLTGTTALVTDSATYSRPAISADGRIVAFASSEGIYVRDWQTGTQEWAGPGSSPAMSADGRFVAFQSGAGIYVRDRQTGGLELVSVTGEGAPAEGSSSAPSMSADGRFIAFQSDAGNLVPGDTNGKRDVFVAERG